MSRTRAAFGFAALALGCHPKDAPTAIDCDTQITYDARDIEAKANVGKFGVEAKSSVEAVRQIDEAVERYLARWKSICVEYNAGVYSKEEYRNETRKMREQMERLDAQLMKLSNAPDSEAYQAALREMYSDIVPDEKRVELGLDFGVLAMAPGEAVAQPIREGATLRTGAKVYFQFQTTASAHVYIYQETPSGEVNVLFPIPQIPVRNPVAAGQTLRVPPEPASFTLNDKDIGEEKIHVIASLAAIPELASAMGAPAPKAADLGCRSRGLEFDAGDTKKCSGPRGLEWDGGGGEPAATKGYSMTAVSAAGDDRIVQVFSFQHAR